MPELPEIETVKLQLGRVLVGRTVSRVEVLNKKSVHGNWEEIAGKKVVEVLRKGKMLQINLSGDMSMAIHFKMTGQLIFETEKGFDDRVVGGHPTEDFVGKLPSSHTRAIFYFDGGSVMYFNDQRMFGWVKIDTRTNIEALPFVKGLGPEPFDIKEDEFVKRISKSRRPIKLVLMDQEIISGVGNIYANDALWEAKTDPKKAANALTDEQYKELFKGILLVLNDGIKYGGATAADAKYIDLHGLGGRYQEHFRTYDQTGKTCKRGDGGVIEKFMMSGRGTYMCPKCQR